MFSFSRETTWERPGNARGARPKRSEHFGTISERSLVSGRIKNGSPTEKGTSILALFRIGFESLL